MPRSPSWQTLILLAAWTAAVWGSGFWTGDRTATTRVQIEQLEKRVGQLERAAK